MGIIESRIVASGHGSLSPDLYAVHSTGNPGATADNHASYWSSNPDLAVHVVADWSKALNTVPYDRLCWQVGNGNSHVEGIEICEATSREDFDAGIRIAARAVAERLNARGWGIDRMVSHKWCSETYGGSDHTDPIPYFDKWGYSWEQFKGEVASALLGGQWIEVDGKWWYRHGDGSCTKDGWEFIDGAWHLFDADGWMLAGWQKVGEDWYLLETKHEGNYGAMLTGWQYVDGAWYYLDSSGAMQTGWLKLDGKWYYLDESGKMQTGWLKIGDEWFWFDGSGVMAEDEVVLIGGVVYGFDKRGAAVSRALSLSAVSAG